METIVIQVHCSGNGRPMRVMFAREDARRPFGLQEVKPGTAVSTTINPATHALPSGGGSGNSPIHVDVSGRAVDASDVRWEGFSCPHCQHDGRLVTVVQCGHCGELICGGTYKVQREKYTFSCGVCGMKGHGRRGRNIRTFDARPGAPAPTLPALPAGRGLLGAAKRLLPRGKQS